MRLTRYTDYAIRVLVFLSARPEKLASIADISRAYGISQNHLMKVVHELGKAGFVTSVRGRSGGIRLARAASEISVGQVVRSTEGGFELADCSTCPIAPACGMTRVLREATQAFLGVLDSYSFAEVQRTGGDVAQLLRSIPPAPVVACESDAGLLEDVPLR